MPLRRSIPARQDPVRRASLERQRHVARTSYCPPRAQTPQPGDNFLRATPAPRQPTPTRAPTPTYAATQSPPKMPRQPPVGTGAWIGPGPRGTAGTTVGPDVKAAGAPTGAVETVGGAPSRVAPVSKLNTTRDASGKLVKRQKPLTRVKVDRVSSDFTEDGGSKNAVLTDDLETFWETEDDSDPPEPWLVMMLSQLDVVTGVYVRFHPGDEAEDLLPVEVETITGASVKTGNVVSRIKIDPKSADLQPLMGPGITSGEWTGMPGAEDHEKFAISKQLLKEVFIVKLVFHGLRDEQEGHIRVRQVLVRTKDMVRQITPPPSAASSSASATEENAGDSLWPSGRQTPSASHASTLAPWTDKAAYQKFQREHSMQSVTALTRAQPERQVPGLNATVVPAEHWSTHGPKYRIKVQPPALQEPIRSELDSLYSHPNTSEETISQGLILMNQTAPTYTQRLWQDQLEFDGRWDEDLSRRSRRRRAASRGSSRPRRGRSTQTRAGNRRGHARPLSRGAAGGSVSATHAAWTEGDAMEMEWWGRVARLAPKGDNRVSEQLSDAYRMMHGSSPFNHDRDDDVDAEQQHRLWQEAEDSELMGGTGDAFRSLLAADAAQSVVYSST